MRGVHVDQYQALRVLGEDVDAVQLGEGVAEWRIGLRQAALSRGTAAAEGLTCEIEIGRCIRFAHGEAALLGEQKSARPRNPLWDGGARL